MEVSRRVVAANAQEEAASPWSFGRVTMRCSLKSTEGSTSWSHRKLDARHSYSLHDWEYWSVDFF